tara:strand:+ start:1114 stop:1500 length:387 start_codon:yes stop_codon:yes gene_type:complete
MCFDVETIIDRIERTEIRKPKIAVKQMVQGTCLVLIEASIFAASVLLTILGLPLFVFLLLAGWDLSLLFAQLGNLADHYASAPPWDRLSFSRALQLAFIGLVGGLTLFRLPTFLRRLAARLDKDMSHD